MKESIVITSETALEIIQLCEGNQHRILPILLSDGRYAISADVLTEKEGIFAYVFAEIDLFEFERISWNEMVALLPKLPEDDLI